ncbi:N-formimino-L-glutamate deiminase, partial [Brucella intermedia M86]
DRPDARCSMARLRAAISPWDAPGDGLKIGASADFIALDAGRLPHAKGDAVLDGWIFGGRAHINDVWVRGVKQVEGGRHRLRDEAERAFQKTIGELLA